MTREDESELARLRLRCRRQERLIEELRTELAQCRMVITAGMAGRRVTVSDGPPPQPPPPRHRLN
jgi:hypothetical protein